MKSCLDCVNCQPDAAPDGFCKVANQPAVARFTTDPRNFSNADMSRCPGFVEDE